MKKNIVIFIATLSFLLIIFLLFFSKTSVKIRQPVDFKKSKFYQFYKSDSLFAVNVWLVGCGETCENQLRELKRFSVQYHFRIISYTTSQDTLAVRKLITKDSILYQNDYTLSDFKYSDSIFSKIYPENEILNWGNVISIDQKQVPYTVFFKNKKIVYQTAIIDSLEIKKLIEN